MKGLFGDPLLLVFGAGVGIVLLCLFFAFGDDKDSKHTKRVDRLKSRVQGQIAEALQLRRETGDRGRIDQLVLRFMPRPELLRERLRRTGRPALFAATNPTWSRRIPAGRSRD